MQYIATAGWDEGITALSERLIRDLGDGQNVLWLVSGGSNVAAAVQCMQAIPEPLTEKLTVMLVDERYGPVGHAESNWQKLIQAGFDPKRATALPVLEDPLSFTQTATRYETYTEQAFVQATTVIAQLGIGEDGHIAGIMVGTADASDTALVTAITTEKLQRLTLTYTALRNTTAAYVFAFGDNKADTLHTLTTRSVTLSEQPAQILKELAEVYIYSDQLEQTA